MKLVRVKSSGEKYEDNINGEREENKQHEIQIEEKEQTEK